MKISYYLLMGIITVLSSLNSFAQITSKVYPDGSKYVGEFKNGEKNGKGTFTWNDGTKYVGEFKNGQMCGQGTITWTNGVKYSGEWKDGDRNGKGTLIEPNGDTYVGEWKDDKIYGNGTFTYATGVKAVGIFNVDKFDGTMYYPNGTKFTGKVNAVTGKGNGTIIYAKGDKYVGDVFEMKPHGKGTCWYSNGSKYVGEWKNDKQNGQGEYYFSSGAIYSGDFKNSKFSGFGRLDYSNGAVYIGNFKDGKKNGEGCMYYSDGTTYFGNYVNDKKHGDGLMTQNDGTTVQGKWNEGKLTETVSVEYPIKKETETSLTEKEESVAQENSEVPASPVYNMQNQSNIQSANALQYQGFPVLPMAQLQAMDPLQVANFCNQFPGGINILLDPRYAMMQAQQQMMMQQQIQSQQREQLQKTWDQMSAQCMQRVLEEEKRFITDYQNFNPGASLNDAMDAYGRYTQGLTQMRNESFNSYTEQRKSSHSHVQQIGETIEYIGRDLSDIAYCKKCDKYLQRHYHKPLTIVKSE